MQGKDFASLVIAVAALIILASGCASSPGGPTSAQVSPPASQTPRSGIFVQQVPITPYMRSQVGTPNELSPLAPSQGRNIRKVGDHWVCEINGRSLIFNGATSCWEPR